MPNVIRAIVLSYDKNRVLVNHMIACYERLWPDHPFLFRIPYRRVSAKSDDIRREYISTPSGIKATVLTLLDDIDDHEWIYWCIDDKYPIELNVETIAMVAEWITKCNSPDVSGILLCRVRRMLDEEFLTGEQLPIKGQILLERKTYHQIWIHQFVRAGVIRHIFSQFPDKIKRASDMDTFKDRLIKPTSHRLYVTQRNQAVFGESTIGGVMTETCLESMLEYNISVPSSFSHQAHGRVTIGEI